MKTNKAGFIGCCSLLLASTVQASEFVFIPRVEAGFSSYSLEFDGQVPVDSLQTTLDIDTEFSGSLFVYRLGATLAYGDFYLDVWGSDSGDLSDVQIFPEFDAIEKWTGSRTEFNATIGYQLFETGSIFVGYRDGESEGDGQINSKFKFKSDGYFVGLNYGFAVGESSVVSLNLAYAFLDASLDETIFGLELDRADGDGDGFKYGVAWVTYPSDTVSFSLSIDRFVYTTDIDSSSGIDVEMTEEESAIRVGISKVF